MSKKSKKRKRKKSSSSSEEDEKESKEEDVTKNHKSAKRRQDVNSQESCAAKTVKDVSQSSRSIKTPVYRLAKIQATDQKPVNKEEEETKTATVSVPLHGGNCSSKAKNDISRKHSTVSGSKPVGRVPQRTEETSKGSLDEKSSHRSPSKLRNQLMSPSLAAAEQKEPTQYALKWRHRAEEPPRTRDHGRIIKTREPSKTSSVSEDSAEKKRRELFEEMCRKHQEHKLKVKTSLRTEARTPSASTTKHSSASTKHTTSVSSSYVVKNVTSGSHKTAKTSPTQQKTSSLAPALPINFKIPKKVQPTQQETSSLAPALPFNFKIPKKVQPMPVDNTGKNIDAVSTTTNLTHGTALSSSEASVSNSKQETVQRAHNYVCVAPTFSSEGQDKRSSSSGKLPATLDAVTEPWNDQMHVVEELHLARSERRLEVNVMQSYGELTCMDIDPPEEGAADTHCKQPPQQGLILVLDTNILLSHLDYVKSIRSHGLGALGFPVTLIPWVVLQELDSLKRGRGLSGSVAHLATPAISYIYNSLKTREPHLWGQSMQQAADSSNGLNAENNDDRVLQCCLQYQSLYPECALIFCTNDKNLCSKALLSGVKALSKSDLEAEVGRSRHGFNPLQNIKSFVLPHISPQVSTTVQNRSYTPVQPHRQETAGPSVGLTEKDNKQQSKIEDEERTKWDHRCVSELEDCLREVLSEVLEVEMKAAYDDLWLEIVYLKPPWTLQDVLQCLKKHWIAVFGHIVPRKKLETVLSLIHFFSSGITADCSGTLAAIQEAKELVKEFRRSSKRVPGAISQMDNIINKLQPKGESPACDVVMNDDDEDKQPTSAQVSHQDVWALFENIWSNVCQISLEVFKALGFDPHTMQSAQPVGSPPPPQDAVVCLHKLSSMVSQLLQAFSSVLSSAPGLEEVQTLLSIIHSNKIVNVDSRLTAKDLVDCFSQQDYREKLRVGGNQLMQLKEVLDHCVGTTGQPFTFTT